MDAQALKEKVRAIWEDALGVTVRDDTDYFVVGGHSFLAIQINSELESAFGTRFPLRVIFDHPEFGDFAEAIIQQLEFAN